MESSYPIDLPAVIAPLGAGDLIDRAVRFYRHNFWSFIFIAAPPVLIGTVILLGWTFLARQYFYQGNNSSDPFSNFAYYGSLWLGGTVIRFIEIVAMLSVMGGASRNFVRHLLFSEKITFRETYTNIWDRLPALLTASSLVAILLGISGIVVFYIGLIVGSVSIFAVAAVFQWIPPLAFVVGAALIIVVAAGTLWLFFLISSRFAYVPQGITVEGLGVFTSMSRSFSLASGNVKRFAALFVFSTVAIYSALAILYVPLAWVAWYQGQDFLEFFVQDQDLIPAWYEIASQLISQLSIILLSPVWTIGLCLLYVDERVRHEGYDIELMAASRLGAIPDVPVDYINPLQPALGSRQMPDISIKPKSSGSDSVLGLN